MGVETMVTSAFVPLEQALQRASLGDDAAFTEIVAAYHHDLLRVCYVVCRDQDVADEAAQAAWVVVWRKLKTLREPERLRSWILTIGANEARKLGNARRRRHVVELSVARSSDRVGGRPSDGDVDLRNALSRLAPEDRALLALRYVAGLSSTELARATRLSASGTRARLARLLERLRVELRDE